MDDNRPGDARRSLAGRLLRDGARQNSRAQQEFFLRDPYRGLTTGGYARQVLRLAPLAAVLSGLVLAVSSAAQIGSGKIAYTTGSLGNPRDGLYAVNIDGSDRTLLKSGEALSSPRWSPDGSRLAFTDYY